MTIPVSTVSQSKAKLQVKCLCVLMFLSFPLSMAEVPGPCRHSITREHLLIVGQLMDNQLRSGCSITYTFIERRTLSKCCFVKAALPWILELLTTHFTYNRGSVNDVYVQSLRALILNMYSQRCVPQINEEVEDKPESFEMVYQGSPMEALQKVSEVLSVYWELVMTGDSPIDWRCQQEYSESFGSMTELPAGSTVQYFTESYDWISAKASQRRPVREVYQLGFIIASICGGLLLILTLYCLIVHKTCLDYLNFQKLSPSGCSINTDNSMQPLSPWQGSENVWQLENRGAKKQEEVATIKHYSHHGSRLDTNSNIDQQDIEMEPQ